MKKWLRNKLWNFMHDHESNQKCVPTPTTAISGAHAAFTGGNSFTLYNAIGGQILEFSNYNQKTDRREDRLYIILDGENFAEQVAQCVTLESLRK